MKLIRTASGKKIIKMNKSEWEKIGQTAGWFFTSCSACQKILLPPKHIPNSQEGEQLKSHGLCPRCFKKLYEKDLLKTEEYAKEFFQSIIEQEHKILNAWKNAGKKPPMDLFVHYYPEFI
jgi:hypothetical protein